MEIKNEVKHKKTLCKKKNFLHIHTHTIKITNYLQQILLHSYMPYVEAGTVVKKL